MQRRISKNFCFFQDELRFPSTMERVLKFRDTQHEEERVKKLHGTGASQTDSGIDQNENDADDSDDENNEETSNPAQTLKKKKNAEKRRRRRAKKKTKSTERVKSSSDNEDSMPTDVEIEYVQEEIPIKKNDTTYGEFVKVFEIFQIGTETDADGDFHYDASGKKVPGSKVPLPRDKTNIEDNEDDDDDDENNSANNQDGKGKADGENQQNQKKSKKKMKRETRMSIAKLKQLVNRPDVVEMFDVTAKDPKILVHLKVRRNREEKRFRFGFILTILGDAKHRPGSSTLVRKAKIFTRKTWYRKAAFSTSGFHSTNWNHGDARSVTGKRTEQNSQTENERKSSTETRKNRHRLSKVARRFFSMANQTQNDNSR